MDIKVGDRVQCSPPVQKLGANINAENWQGVVIEIEPVLEDPDGLRVDTGRSRIHVRLDEIGYGIPEYLREYWFNVENVTSLGEAIDIEMSDHRYYSTDEDFGYPRLECDKVDSAGKVGVFLEGDDGDLILFAAPTELGQKIVSIWNEVLMELENAHENADHKQQCIDNLLKEVDELEELIRVLSNEEVSNNVDGSGGT